MIKKIAVLFVVFTAFLGSCKNDDSSVTPTINTNHPPSTPHSPSPPDSASNVSRFVVLSWQCSDPDEGDTLRYDVFWGTGGTTGNVAVTNTLQTSFDLGLVASQVTIFWRVVAKDNHGLYTDGPVWRFTTQL
jgi:TolB protein